MTLFLANSGSFHLATWTEIYRRLGREKIDLATIHDVVDTNQIFAKVARISARSKFLAYILLGLKLRATRAPWVHAHGASGYGLAALVSGKPYVATVYGSEVLASHGYLYRMMMIAILRRARAVTVTSEATRDVIVRDFGVRPERVHSFHTGIDTDALDALEAPDLIDIAEDGKIIFSMRNAAPTYRTQDIIEACAELVERGRTLVLVVPLGNGDTGYFRDLQARYPFDWIYYLDRRLENREMLTWMRRADVCVSNAATDQMSTTILEAIYLARAVVVGWLDAYTELAQASTENTNIYFVRGACFTAALEAALDRGDGVAASSVIRKNYSVAQAVRHHAMVLEGFID